jgi:hydrogenase small subunit
MHSNRRDDQGLIFDSISLDYHHTLQAASGDAAEAARHAAMKENMGQYLVLVDGSIPMGNPGFSTIAGISNYDMLMETVEGAAAVRRSAASPVRTRIQQGQSR